MEGDVWKKIIDDTRGLGVTYRPFLLNEPFTDRRMPEIVSYIHQDPTAKVEFNTNGSLLSPLTARWLANSGISVIRFSLDGFTEETLKATRGLSRDQCYAGILDYIEQNRYSDQPAKVEVRMINMPDNMHAICKNVCWLRCVSISKGSGIGA
jgi:MoaA/NifB/PqqE/SkfB family radical SAM enzyme